MRPELEETFAAMRLYGDIKSRRGKVDFHYRTDAMSALKDDPDRFSWLCDHKTEKIRASILTELGRLKDPEAIRAFAARICDLKPSTKAAVAMLRRARIDRSPPASAEHLADVIADAINGYAATHSFSEDASEMILGALELVAARVRR